LPESLTRRQNPERLNRLDTVLRIQQGVKLELQIRSG
jgi:hypothetical protein